MAITSFRQLLSVITISLLTDGSCLARAIEHSETFEGAVIRNQEVATSAPDILFTNLTRLPGRHYDTGNASIIAGKSVHGQNERWAAMRFRSTVSGQATVLSAAIGYISGTKLVTLGIYSDDDGKVGTLLPGGSGSTTVMPNVGDCCRLATVTLSGAGVALTANTNYWLVGGPDDVNAPDFYAWWQVSNSGAYAGLVPPLAWDPQPSQWLAAQIQGTRSGGVRSSKRLSSAEPTQEGNELGNGVVIFTNLDRTSTQRYLLGSGTPIYGDNVLFEPEVWEALPFTPKTNVHLKTVRAAIGYTGGTRRVNIGIYSDNGGVPGVLLPSAQLGTTDIPDAGDCCELAEIRFAGTGIALSAGVQYWLVVSPDDANAPDFQGVWQGATISLSAYLEPEDFGNWTSFDGHWEAAELRGTNP